MDFLYRHGWSLFLLLAGIAVLVATFFNSISDTNQKDNIEKLTSNIDTLTQSTKRITEENFKLSQQSIEVISQIGTLSNRIDDLVKSIDKKVTYASEENLQSGEIKINFEQDFLADISVSYGTRGFKVTNNRENIKKGARFFSFGDVDPVSFNLKNNKLILTFKVFDIDGNAIAEIEDNYWRPYKNFIGLMNYDERGFEVLDRKGNIAVSINVVGSNDVIIQGIFPIKSVETVYIAGQALIFIPLNREKREDIFKKTGSSLEKIIEEAKMERIFVYTGKDWLHKRK